MRRLGHTGAYIGARGVQFGDWGIQGHDDAVIGHDDAVGFSTVNDSGLRASGTALLRMIPEAKSDLQLGKGQGRVLRGQSTSVSGAGSAEHGTDQGPAHGTDVHLARSCAVGQNEGAWPG